ncbi:MAG TPA: outer membrane lipoprotein-sorting protein [Nitrospiria bacterium]|nr:outer membrane lipoprotein-sorting protein [Nitrospiria bacterium]
MRWIIKYSLSALPSVLILLYGQISLTQELQETPITAEEIVRRSEEVHPGKDHASKLIFTIRDQDGSERREVLRRFWKAYGGKGGLDFKLIVFNEYPPDKKGNAFLEWSYRPGSGKEPDRKFYLKFLNTVNKVPKGSDEGFASSDLKPSEMAPRPVDLDTHNLLKEEVIESRPYYVVESVPKRLDPSYTYSKVVKWITKGDFLKERIEYYDPAGKLFKEQIITWKKIKDAWVWEKVVTTNAQTKAQTFLTISDIKVDSGLSEDLFTERSMKRGVEAVP